MHADFEQKHARRLKGRALDLKRAFKQLPIVPSMLRLAVVGLYHPQEKEVRYFALRALPFGARNAVYAFGGVARGLEMIMVNLFAFLLEQYVDDFPHIEPAELCDQGVQPEHVLDLLGWDIKEPDGITPQTCDEFDVLGVHFDLRETRHGVVKVSDKPGRRDRIEELVKAMLAPNAPLKKLAESLRGVLGFSRAQCFGRMGSMALHYLSRIAAETTTVITDAGASHLRFWPDYLKTASPREIVARDFRRPALIFTDGSEEGEGADVEVGVGGVLVDPERTDIADFLGERRAKNRRMAEGTSGRQAFGGRVRDDLVRRWKTIGGHSKTIHQAELLPVGMALDLWADMLAGRKVIVFVDNEAARGSIVKGASRSEPSAQIVNYIWEKAVESHIHLWIDRVPSPSNPADGPSRSDWAWLNLHGFERQGHASLSGEVKGG